MEGFVVDMFWRRSFSFGSFVPSLADEQLEIDMCATRGLPTRTPQHRSHRNASISTRP